MLDITYRVKRVLNNNVVQAKYGYQEVIVVGLGIGFNAKTRDIIDPEKIEKVFELRKEEFYKTSQLVEEIPEKIFFNLYQILERTSHITRIKLSSHGFVTIIDHLNFAIARHTSGQTIRNLMLYDLRILYPDEFRLGELILESVNEEMNLDLPQDEVGFLTMHIVNGHFDQINNQSNVLTNMVLDSLNIIRDRYLVSLKLDELITQRIMVHLKMLIQRVMSNQQVDFDEVVLYNVIEEFESAYSTAELIQKYIENRLSVKINSQELVYLTIHLNRLEQMIP
ncbi:MAG: PRD domain-containing protein [Erysipelothrix sp.]|nr:PRD domain-containing protein [Erysipelothrix sp.]